jgi:uncharacterized membrane protein
MAIGQVTAKIILTVINLVFCVMAIVLVMMGSWLFSQYYNYDHVASDKSTLIPSCLTTTIGFLLLLVGILGFIVTYKANICLTRLFLVILVFLLIGLIVGSVLAYMFRKDIDSTLDSAMKVAMEDYDSNELVRKEVDFMQSELKCCGVDNYTDWKETSWYHNQTKPRLPYPASCCKDNCTYLFPDPQLHGEGCYGKLKRDFLNHLTAVASVAAGCAGLLLLGMICIAILLHRRSTDVGYIGLPESDSLHV